MSELQAQRSDLHVPWQQFVAWARQENEYQKKIAGVHQADRPAQGWSVRALVNDLGAGNDNPLLRGRTYFDVNLYRYFHALNVCWPYLNRPGQKIMDVGSWPGSWLRVIAHFAAKHHPKAWASGLMFPDGFLEKMGGACAGMLRCEFDPYSPMRDTTAPTMLAEKDFMFVSAMEVIEHLYHPKGMFQVIYDAMAPGGILFVTTNNVGRLSNLFAILTGGGLVGNLEELIPSGGGILGNWRPHAREYAWREINLMAQSAGFAPITHGFYQENYALRLLEGIDHPSEQLTFPRRAERRLARELGPLLAEPDQLKSGMYLLFQKPEA